MSFDLSRLDTATRADQGVDMKVLNPRTGQPVRDSEGNLLVITLMGRNSERAQSFRLQSADERRRFAQENGRPYGAEELRDETTRYLATLTVGWSFTHLDGEEFPFSYENAKRLFGDRRFTFIREQADAHIHADGNFMIDSSDD